MALHKCPGMNPANFKPEDVHMHDCIHCGSEMEFWKDDIKLQCKKCGQYNFNPTLSNTCLTYCKSAADCLGQGDVHQWLKSSADTGPPESERGSNKATISTEGACKTWLEK